MKKFPFSRLHMKWSSLRTSFATVFFHSLILLKTILFQSKTNKLFLSFVKSAGSGKPSLISVTIIANKEIIHESYFLRATE